MPSRYRFIDALRGFAAVWVVLFHIKHGGHIDQLAKWLPGWLDLVVFELGHLGVPIFFVLSGFVIAHCFQGATVSLGYASRFALRRSIRLDPPYWVSIVVLTAYGFVSAKVQGEAYAFPTLGSVAAHAFYLQGFLGYEPFSVIYWTLCQEFQFYLVFAFLLWCSQSALGASIGGFRTFFVGAGLVSLLWPSGILSTADWYVWWLPFWHGFLLGAFAYWAWTKKIPNAMFLLYAAVLGVIGIVQGSGFTNMCVGTSLVIFAVADQGQLSTWLSWRVFQWFGMISYSLYLTHTPVSGGVGFVIRKLCGVGMLADAVSLVTQLVATTAFAAMIYYTVERPCIAWSRRIKLTAKQQANETSENSVDAQIDKTLGHDDKPIVSELALDPIH